MVGLIRKMHAQKSMIKSNNSILFASTFGSTRLLSNFNHLNQNVMRAILVVFGFLLAMFLGSCAATDAVSCSQSGCCEEKCCILQPLCCPEGE